MSNARDPLAEMIETTFRESRQDGMPISATADMIASVLREVILERIGEKETEESATADHVMMQSVVGAGSGNPAVQFRVGFEQWQLSAEEARAHGLAVLGCAEAAIHDAAVLRWLTLGEIGLDTKAAAQAILDLRRFRGDVAREDWRPPKS